MRFMMIIKSNEESEAGVLPEQELLVNMGNLMQEMAQAGVLLGGEGLRPSSEGKRISMKDGKIARVVDGPFAEVKELIGGYCLIDVPSWDDVMPWIEKFAAVVGHGESEIRPMFETEDFPDFPPEEAAKEEALRAELQKKGRG